MTTGVLRVADNVLMQTVADEVVFLNTDSGVYYGLDAIGTRMALLLLEEPDEDTVVRTLVAEYDTTEETLRGDVARIIRELVAEGLVERVDGAAMPADPNGSP